VVRLAAGPCPRGRRAVALDDSRRPRGVRRGPRPLRDHDAAAYVPVHAAARVGRRPLPPARGGDAGRRVVGHRDLGDPRRLRPLCEHVRERIAPAVAGLHGDGVVDGAVGRRARRRTPAHRARARGAAGAGPGRARRGGGRQPGEGRVPDDAGPRAAQPARGHHRRGERARSHRRTARAARSATRSPTSGGWSATCSTSRALPAATSCWRVAR